MARLHSSLELTMAILERLLTFAYYESFQRNTVEPLNRILAASDDDVRIQLLRGWSDIKAEESKYIQIAGGFLFTTVASSLTWPSTESSHWSGAALFYASTIFALVAIISGSQQLWILPRFGQDSPGTDAEKDRRKHDIVVFLSRLQRADDCTKAKKKYVFALQTPIMLLAFSVMTFLAGLCSVVYSPLSAKLAWDDNAKTAVLFSICALVAGTAFVAASSFVYALFRASSDEKVRE